MSDLLRGCQALYRGRSLLGWSETFAGCTNKVEHRLFSFISSNWRGEPLRDYETIVRLIAKTTTAKGLQVTCRLDRRKYPSGRKVSDEEMNQVNISYEKFHGDWNYIIRPRTMRT